MNTSGSHPGDESASARPEAQRSAAPPTIPDYQLQHRIGSGAYGDVWLARSTATNVFRAVKIIYRSTFSDERPYQREFEGILKFEAVSRSHPSQLALFHVGRDETAGYFYYVMELADPATPGRSSTWSAIRNQTEAGNPALISENNDSLVLLPDYSPRTLHSDLKGGRMPVVRVLELGLALSEALADLHAHGLACSPFTASKILFVNGLPKFGRVHSLVQTSPGDDCPPYVVRAYATLPSVNAPFADLLALIDVLYNALTGFSGQQFPEIPIDLQRGPAAALNEELITILNRAYEPRVSTHCSCAAALRSDLEQLTSKRWVKKLLKQSRATTDH
ncbi:MAG: hypothetical protein JNL10_07820 [Verrucomicrobiales bacterium]|nr:hypothetical protein [Verrucomicrobiales bacterium]